MTRTAKRCPNCPDQGWWTDADPRNGDPVQVQCTFCHSEADSVFNICRENEELRSRVETADQMVGLILAASEKAPALPIGESESDRFAWEVFIVTTLKNCGAWEATRSAAHARAPVFPWP